MKSLQFLKPAVALAALSCAVTGALAECVSKTKTSSSFDRKVTEGLAWESLLSEIDAFLQVEWLTKNGRPGEAPGYTVKNFTMRCNQDNSPGFICTTSATLCKQSP